VVSVWYRYATFGRVRDSFDDDGVHNLDDQRGKSLCVYSMHMGSLLTGRASLTNEFLSPPISTCSTVFCVRHTYQIFEEDHSDGARGGRRQDTTR